MCELEAKLLLLFLSETVELLAYVLKNTINVETMRT
jgi:hypothetical protein